MNRRTFLAGTGAVFLAAPLAVEAEQTDIVPRIGYLGTSPSEGDPEPFRQGLRELGRVEGQNVRIEYRWTGGQSQRAPELLAELIQLKVEVIYTPGSVAVAQAAKRATTTIPIVFWTPADPVQAGLVASLARPGGNVTGLTGGGIQGSKRLALLKEAVPKARKIAILWNPTNPVHESALKDIEDAARPLRLQLHAVGVSQPGEIESAFSAIARGHADALYVVADAMLGVEQKRIITLSAKGHLPTIYPWRTAAEAGGLMSYQVDWSGSSRRAASYVDKILKGAKPGDLPVEQPTKFELVINLKTAKALGLTIPPSLLGRADEVIQ